MSWLKLRFATECFKSDYYNITRSGVGRPFGVSLRSAMSILQLLMDTDKRGDDIVDLTCHHAAHLPKLGAPVPTAERYLESIMKLIDAGKLDLKGQPLIQPMRPLIVASAINEHRRSAHEAMLNEEELATLVLRPNVFAWAPDVTGGGKLQGGHRTCKNTHVRASWLFEKCFVRRLLVALPGTFQIAAEPRIFLAILLR